MADADKRIATQWERAHVDFGAKVKDEMLRAGEPEAILAAARTQGIIEAAAVVRRNADRARRHASDEKMQTLAHVLDAVIAEVLNLIGEQPVHPGAQE
jgi:hypothetical protein